MSAGKTRLQFGRNENPIELRCVWNSLLLWKTQRSRLNDVIIFLDLSPTVRVLLRKYPHWKHKNHLHRDQSQLWQYDFYEYVVLFFKTHPFRFPHMSHARCWGFDFWTNVSSLIWLDNKVSLSIQTVILIFAKLPAQ